MFGSWSVVSLERRYDSGGQLTVLCRCAHTEKWVRYSNLMQEESLGCRKCFLERNSKYSKEEAYWLERFRNLRARSYNPKNPTYPLYGGRGIYVNQAWLDSPLSFAQFIINTFPDREGKSIDRIDNDGPYTPENIRLVNASIQTRNTRRNRDVVYKDEAMCLTDFVKKHTQLTWSYAYRLYEAGMPLEELANKIPSPRKHKGLRHCEQRP